MTDHNCRTFDPNCFRCDLSRDEIESERIDHERVAKLLRGVARHPKRRPGTRGLLFDLADELLEKAREMRPPGEFWDCADVAGGDSCSLSNPCPAHATGPHLATADDVIDGRARYADTPGGHADRKTLAKEAVERTDGACTCQAGIEGDIVTRSCIQHGPGGIYDQFGPAINKCAGIHGGGPCGSSEAI